MRTFLGRYITLTGRCITELDISIDLTNYLNLFHAKNERKELDHTEIQYDSSSFSVNG